MAPLLLAALAALAVAAVLVPAEAATQRGTHAVLVVLWLVLALAWWAVGLLEKTRRVRFGAVDRAVVALVGWHVVSAAVMARYGSPRGSINAAWQWAAFGLVFLLARQVLDSAASRRALCSVMIGLGVCLSVHGFHQYAIGMPAARAEYRADPQRVLRRQGIAADPQSPSRMRYENRLNSTEPLATFSLANSLAGYLVPWLVVVLGIVAGNLVAWSFVAGNFAAGNVATGQTIRRPGVTVLRVGLLAGLCVLPLVACLILTKSRSAYLAAMVGAATVVGVVRGRRVGRSEIVAVASAGTIALLAAVAIAIGALDVEVLSEAPKSILYRLEYWRATASMIADYPIFGCGPGNFQDTYTAFKLPQASETVADPHNFMLEIWATAGTPAMLALLAVGWFSIRRAGSAVAGAAPAACNSAAGRIEVWAVYVGAAVGVAIAFPIGFLVDSVPDVNLLWGLLPAAACIAILDPWTRRGRLPALVPMVAVGALLVHLLAAGGIGFAGVANSLWLLLPVALNDAEDPAGGRRASRSVPRWGMAVGAVATLLLLAGCYQTLYRPTLTSQALLPAGRLLRFEAIDAVRQGHQWGAQVALNQAETKFAKAARGDRFSSRARLELAALHHARWLQTGAPADRERFERFVEDGLALNVRSASARRQVGEWRLEAYRVTGESEMLEGAIDALAQAASRYPADAMIHAEWAWTRHLAGDAVGAARQAELALELDGRNPHADKKLAGRRLPDPGPWPKHAPLQKPGPSGQNVEQQMQLLRKL